VAQLEALDLPEVVAVDLEGERPVGLHEQVVDVGSDVEGPVPADVAAGQGRTDRPDQREEGQ
jgi:hypothetical protein